MLPDTAKEDPPPPVTATCDASILCRCRSCRMSKEDPPPPATATCDASILCRSAENNQPASPILTNSAAFHQHRSAVATAYQLAPSRSAIEWGSWLPETRPSTLPIGSEATGHQPGMHCWRRIECWQCGRHSPSWLDLPSHHVSGAEIKLEECSSRSGAATTRWPAPSNFSHRIEQPAPGNQAIDTAHRL